MLTGSPVTALRTAHALLQGQLPLAESLGISIPYDPHHDMPHLDWIFEAETMVADYSRPESRYLVAPPGVLTEAEEGLASMVSPSLHGRELATRALSEAASAALKMLVELAETADHLAPRFRARLCAACREELAALVADHAALEVAR